MGRILKLNFFLKGGAPDHNNIFLPLFFSPSCILVRAHYLLTPRGGTCSGARCERTTTAQSVSEHAERSLAGGGARSLERAHYLRATRPPPSGG